MNPEALPGYVWLDTKREADGWTAHLEFRD